ncbi:MAG: tetrahydromethanopterin S-methyltransferase subunit H [Methanothrix sp.]|nr:tetrahydromethanopterin S-methyltransferase subunit H [Methanothrix sp.]MCX8206432.1 tetrahydromethanopterin S-methyltransferase subunit H [Methanothrix sp.]
MFRFARDQSVINIAGLRIGGQPGELPTALAGTVFYHGHNIVSNEEMGIFDGKRAEELINKQAEISEETGNPGVLHIFASTRRAFEKYLDFIDPIWNGPLIIDSFDPGTRAEMAIHVTEVGYADRTIYNSIGLASNEMEMRLLMESDIDSAILLAFSPNASSVESRMELLSREGGLLAVARDAGINNMLLDPGVAPLGSGAGAALRFAIVAKAKLGLPVCSGMHNAASSWEWLRSKDRSVRNSCDASTAALAASFCASLVLYGPIENAETVFPVVAMTDIMISEALEEMEVWPVWSHPRNRMV